MDKFSDNSNKLKSLLVNAPEHITTVNKDLIITDINHTVAGLKKDKVIGSKVTKFVNKSYHKVLKKTINHVFKTGKSSSFESIAVGPNGTKAYYLNKVGPVKIGGRVVEVAIFGSNITEQKKIEEVLNNREQNLKKVFDTSPSAIIITKIKDGTFVDVNENALKMTGYKRSDILGKSAKKGIWIDNKQREEMIKLLKKNKQVDNFEVQIRRKDGSIMTGLMSVRIIQYNNEPHLLSVTKDISDLVTTRKKLENSEAIFKGLFNNVNSGIVITDKNGFIREINIKALKILEIKKDFIINKNLLEFVRDFKVEVKDALNAFKNALLNKGKRQKIWNITTPKGNKKILRIDAAPIKKGYLSAIIQDITELTKNKEQLERDAKLFKDLYETTFTLKGSTDHILKKICEKVHELFGGLFVLVNYVKASEFNFKSGCNLPRAIIKSGKEPIKGAICSHVLETKKPLFNNNLKKDKCPGCGMPFNKDPAVNAFNLNTYFGAPLIFSNGSVHGTLCIVYKEKKEPFSKKDTRILSILARRVAQEIEQEEKENKLIKNQKQLKATLGSTADGILTIDDNRKVLNYNDKFLRLWNIPKKIIESKDDKKLLNYVTKQLINPKEFLSKVEELYKNKKEDFDRIRFKDGRVFKRFSKPIIKDEKIAGRLWSFSDITKRVLAEDKLKESEERYRQIVQEMPYLSMLLDAKGNVIDANKQAEKISGLRLSKDKGKSFAKLGLLNNKGLLKAFNEFRKNLSGKITGKTIYEINVNGEKKLVELMGIPIKEKGKVVRVIDIGREITKEIIAENKIKESKNMLKLITENAEAGLLFTDENARIIDFNPKAEEIFEIKKEDALKMKGWDFMSKLIKIPFSNTLSKMIIKRVLKTGKIKGKPIEAEIKTKKGVKTVLIKLSVIKTTKGRSLILTANDITFLKRTQDELKKIAAVTKYSGDLINISKPDGQMTFINKAGGEMLGINPNEIEKHNIFEVIPENLMNLVKNELITNLMQGKTWVGELKYINLKTKKLTPVNARTFPIKNKKGEIIYFANVSRDITKLKKAEKESKKQSMILQSTIESTIDGILVVNNEGKVLYHNSQFAKLWAIPEEILKSKEDDRLLKYVLSQLKHPKQFLKKVKELYKSEKTDKDILEFKDGRYFERNSSPLIQEKKIIGRLWNFRDITKEKKNERIILDYNKELEKQVEERTKELRKQNLETVARSLDLTEAKRVLEDQKIELIKLKKQLEKKVDIKTGELQEKVRILERFTKIAVERELKMKELKKQIRRMKK